MLDIVFFLAGEAGRLLGAALAGLLAGGAFWLIVQDDNETVIRNQITGADDCVPWTFAEKGGLK